MSQYKPVLTYNTLNSLVKRCRYEVRGPLVTMAQIYDAKVKAEKQCHIAAGKPAAEFKSPYAFDEVVFCNIGNPQQLGQKPFSYLRKVMGLLEDQDHLKLLQNKSYYEHPANEIVRQMYPADIIARALKLKDALGVGGLGAYSKSQGVDHVRNRVCEFLKARDGDNIPTDPDNIFLSAGASACISEALRLFCREPKDAVLSPKPEYPLYAATITLLDASSVPYELVESNNWEISVQGLQKSLEEAKAHNMAPKCVVVINPGNPTGCTMSRATQEGVVKFCVDNGLVLLADEVYQINLYSPKAQFTSFKKVVSEMPAPYNKLELFSFHSISKGLTGECGHRGGYCETTNILPEVKREYLKMFSKNLCSNVPGQIMVELMLHPPVEGEPSYPEYKKERDAIYESLKTRSQDLISAMKELKPYGVDVHFGDSSMYVFPSVTIPPMAVEKSKIFAEKMVKEHGGSVANYPPDFYYCAELLERTGMCVVPGSGFGQADGTYHFRTTFLPSPDKIKSVTDKWAAFHKKFMTENGFVPSVAGK